MGVNEHEFVDRSNFHVFWLKFLLFYIIWNNYLGLHRLAMFELLCTTYGFNVNGRDQVLDLVRNFRNSSSNSIENDHSFVQIESLIENEYLSLEIYDVNQEIREDLKNQHAKHTQKIQLLYNEVIAFIEPYCLFSNSTSPSIQLKQRIKQRINYFHQQYTHHLQTVIRSHFLYRQQQIDNEEFEKVDVLFESLKKQIKCIEGIQGKYRFGDQVVLDDEIKNDLKNQNAKQLEHIKILYKEVMDFKMTFLSFSTSTRPSIHLKQRVKQRIDYFHQQYTHQLQQVIRSCLLCKQQKFDIKELEGVTSLFKSLKQQYFSIKRIKFSL